MRGKDVLGLVLAGAVVSLTSFSFGFYVGDDPAKVGNTTVPRGLRCEEDEVIAFKDMGQTPYGLSCVHYEEVGE